MIMLTLFFVSLLPLAQAETEPQDPHLWLEGVEDEKLLIGSSSAMK